MGGLTAAAGAVIIIGSLVFIFAVVPVSGAYGGRDPDEVIEHIRARWRRYVISQAIFAFGAVVTAIGMALLAARFFNANGPLLSLLGAACMVGGGIMWSVLSYDRTVNYERFFREYGRFPISAWGWLVLTGSGLAIYGYLLTGAGMPALVGFVTWALVGLQIVGAILFPKLVPPQIYYLATLLIGTVALSSL